MFRHAMDAIISELHLGRCLRDIAQFWACRSTVPGPGLTAAAQFLQRRYAENGVPAPEIIPYPADDRTESIDGQRNPLAWTPRDARLEVVAPAGGMGVICRYDDEPLCLVCNSTPTPAGGVEAELVVRSGPLSVTRIVAGELRGKILLSDQPPGSVQAAATKAGAVGVISDCVCPPWLASHPPVREPEDEPDLVMWTIFSGRRDEPPLFGFNLSARQGRRLRQLIASSDAPVILRAWVDCDLAPGTSELVHAAVPGTDLAAEEVWVLAHLSEPGARDNASGCCLSLELARTLLTLTGNGTLPPLRRTVRFMHAVEVSGFLPYLAENLGRLPCVVAGLCLDSVGQSFRLCGGEMVMFRSPEEAPSFVDGLMEELLTAAAAEPVGRFTTDNYAIFPWHCEPFWGNDAFISDGFFGIPTPQMSNWPDRFYHSSKDRPEGMCENTLGRAAATAGAYLHLLATAGATEARWLGCLAATDYKRRMATAIARRTKTALCEDTPDEAARRMVSELRHLGLQAQDAVVQAGRFAPEDCSLARSLSQAARQILDDAERDAVAAAEYLGVAVEPDAAAEPVAGDELVVRRLRWAPPPDSLLSEGARQRLTALAGAPPDGLNLSRIWRWIDGRRSAAQIERRLRHDGPIPLPTVVEYLEIMEQEGMVAAAVGR